MELHKRLLMTFKIKDEKKISLSVDDPREYISASEIKAVMDLMVSKNIFTPNGMYLVVAVEAIVVITDTALYDLVL